MQTGTALIAPEGYMDLEKNLTYYYLRDNRAKKTVSLVLFSQGKPLKAILTIMPRAEFEAGLAQKWITPGPQSTGLPPWLENSAKNNSDFTDVKGPDATGASRRYTEGRLLAIAPLLEREHEILQANSPEREINCIARANGLNAPRARLWFLSYLCFGRNMSALTPLYFDNGKWDRYAELKGANLGRPSIVRGKRANRRLTPTTVKMIVDSFAQLSRPGSHFCHVYAEAMVSVFKAKILTDENHKKRLVPTTITPIPSIDQYRYQVFKAIGHDEVQRSLYGHTRSRRQFAEHVGKFSSSVSNLYEVIEADGYYTKDHPKNYLNEAVLPKLCVVLSVDTASALRLGIGFVLGKEDSYAYHAMLFSMAISKVKFCSLFGIKIKEGDWPSIGLPMRYVIDRGPGIKREAGEEIDPLEKTVRGIVSRELTPSGQGQGKPYIESSHPRGRKLEGPQTELISDLSLYQMMQREIRRLLADNSSADASNHTTPEMIQSAVFPTPLGVWGFLDERGRNDGVPISFDNAVRRFLKDITVNVKRDGVWLGYQRYDSQALRDTGLLQKIARTKPMKLKGYLYPYSVRFIWIEINGELIEVDAQLAMRDDDAQVDRTYLDLLAEKQTLDVSKAELRQHRPAARAEQRKLFEEETGGNWDSNKRRARSTLKHPNASKSDIAHIKKLGLGEALV